MTRYIFNNIYFKNEYCGKKSIEEKIGHLCEKCHMSVDTFKAKKAGKRYFTEADYDTFSKGEEAVLLLDTQKLIYVFLERVNLDLFPNEKYVAYIMLCMYEEKKGTYVSIDELKEVYSFDEIKVQNVLDNAKIEIDETGSLDKMFLKKDVSVSDGKVSKYMINITAFIKYVNMFKMKK